VTWIYDKLMRGEKINIVNDSVKIALQPSIGRASGPCSQTPSGIFHIAGRDGSTATNSRLRSARLRSRRIADARLQRFFKEIAQRQRHAFVTTRMERELGVAAMTLEEGLRAMKRTEKGV